MANSGIIITDVANYFGTFHMRNVKNKNKVNSINQVRLFSENNINKFNEMFTSNWLSPYPGNNEPQWKYTEFYQLYKSALNSVQKKEIIV